MQGAGALLTYCCFLRQHVAVTGQQAMRVVDADARSENASMAWLRVALRNMTGWRFVLPLQRCCGC
jgi:hypothetical protein